jgi:hypothetical protein
VDGRRVRSMGKVSNMEVKSMLTCFGRTMPLHEEKEDARHTVLR